MAGNSAVAGQSVASKLSAILLTFNEGGTHTFTEIAQLTGLTLSTTHRLATELAAHQVLERTTDGRLRPGASLRTLAAPPVCSITVRNTASAVLDDIAHIMRREVRFGTLNHLRVTYLRKVPGYPVSNVTRAATLPIHATALGKILLAFAPSQRLETVISQGLCAYTPHTETGLDRFRYTIKLARQHGYAVADNELRLHYSAVAVPVFGPGGNLAAAIELQVDDIARAYEARYPHSRWQHTASPVNWGNRFAVARQLKRPHCRCTLQFRCTRRRNSLGIARQAEPRQRNTRACHTEIVNRSGRLR
jgi:DNA-binding IclR family transcriptional regulator